MKILSIVLLNCLISISLLAQDASIYGKITDSDTGESILFGNVALFKNDILVTGVQTDFDGNYSIYPIDPGTYKVEVTYVGYTSEVIIGFVAQAGKRNRLDIQLSNEAVSLDCIVVTEYQVPLIEQDNFSQGNIYSSERIRTNSSGGGYAVRKKRKKKNKEKTLTSEQVRSLPTRSINALATTSSGVSVADEGEALNIRSSRSKATDYYLDGVRVSGRQVPIQDIQQIEEYQSGGTPAQFGHNNEFQQNTGEGIIIGSKVKKELTPIKPNSSDMLPSESNTESYAPIIENEFIRPDQEAFSTFSIDVDNASYTNTRRFINSNQMPPRNAVRTEEFVNYFNYDYPLPENDVPFEVYSEVGACPWNDDAQLLHLGLQGENINLTEAPNSNLVFLIDVSGSMSARNKLDLVKPAMKVLIENLRPEDRVAMVVYAGSAGLVLPSTWGYDKKTILKAIDNLKAGGSTAGGAGIKLAYKVAKQNFIEGGNNRVILATDGDFNVGVSSQEGLQKLIEEKRKEGVFLTCLGFGMGNYQDNKLELLANKGNGNYNYIDNLREAKKVFGTELTGTIYTIAKDVKIQIVFNPDYVQSYRLVGYENRLLEKEDFDDDTKDAGELGAGHTVTALYEIIPTEIASQTSQKNWATVKLRYKKPDVEVSQLIEQQIDNQNKSLDLTSENFQFSAAVAGFSLLLRDSKFKGDLTYRKILDLAKKSKGEDELGYRQEFLNMVESVEVLNYSASK